LAWLLNSLQLERCILPRLSLCISPVAVPVGSFLTSFGSLGFLLCSFGPVLRLLFFFGGDLSIILRGSELRLRSRRGDV
jgi:hypothetical protein